MLEIFDPLFATLFDDARLPVAAGALVLSVIIGIAIGPVGGDANPLFWRVITGLLGKFGDRMDKAGRPRGDLILRGFFITVVGIAISYFLGMFIQYGVESISFGSILEVLILACLISSGALWIVLIKLYRALESKTVGEGVYYALARTQRHNLSGLDDFSITRSGCSAVIRSFDKAIVAPILWYWALGLPAVFVYGGLCALNLRFARDGTSNGFALVMGALEKLMGVVPSLVSAFSLSLACVFTPTAMMSKALKGWNAHKNKAAYAEGGLVLTAVAWGLNITLGGPATDLDGYSIQRNWVGPEGATAQLESKHLHRAVYCVFIASLLFFMALIGAMVISGNHLLDF